MEDDPRDIELTLTALSDHNLANAIAIARDGVEALDYLYQRGNFVSRSSGNPLFILLDIKMPRVDGLQVLRQIKADPQLRNIPIIIITSSREARDLEACYELGANAYVVKPVRFSEFINTVKGIGLFWALINEPPPGSVNQR